MLLRRLKSGKLTPTSISPLLTDSQKVGQVVLVPDNLEDPNSVALLIAQTLLQYQFQLGLFQGKIVILILKISMKAFFFPSRVPFENNSWATSF